jgi:colicin import membrane protein
MRDDLNIIPVTLAILLHAVIAALMIFAIDFSSDERPATPLAINASLVALADIPTVVRSEPEPVVEEPLPPEPEPEPEPERPDPAELERERLAEQQRLEEQKRQQDAREEQERVRQIQLREEQERIRKEQEAERVRREKAEAERLRREEAEKEQQRQEAERKRREEVERQRLENERKRQEAEEAERRRRLDAELAEEARRLEAMQSGEMARYIFAIQQKIQRNWVRPPSAQPGIECVALVRQLPGGEVVGVTIDRCNGDAAVQRSIEAAIYKASPLPQPQNSALFDRNLRITVKPEQ